MSWEKLGSIFPPRVPPIATFTIKKKGNQLEEFYVDSLAGWLQAAYPNKYKGQDPKDENSELHKKKIYSPKLAPGNGVSTEAFLKSRELFSPVYFHNEIVTRYLMVSSIKTTSNQQKNSIDFTI